jgi:hypothetical protein
MHEFNRAAGMTGLAVIAIEALPLTDQFIIATVEWGATFEKTGDEQVRFKITYILQDQDGAGKILGYLSHEDQMDAMRAKGLL